MTDHIRYTYHDLCSLPDGKVIANNTTLTNPAGWESLTIKLHGNSIAVLTPTRIWITDAGWSTLTTTERLSAIVHENFPGQFYVYRKSGSTWIERRSDGLKLSLSTSDPVMLSEDGHFLIDPNFKV